MLRTLVVLAVAVGVRLRILTTRHAVELQLDLGNPSQLGLEFVDHHFHLCRESSNRPVSWFARRAFGAAWASRAGCSTS